MKMPTEAEIEAWKRQLSTAREERHVKLHRAAEGHMKRMREEMQRWQTEITQIEYIYLMQTERLDIDAINEG
jgi:hypothetical protein